MKRVRQDVIKALEHGKHCLSTSSECILDSIDKFGKVTPRAFSAGRSRLQRAPRVLFAIIPSFCSTSQGIPKERRILFRKRA